MWSRTRKTALTVKETAHDACGGSELGVVAHFDDPEQIVVLDLHLTETLCSCGLRCTYLKGAGGVSHHSLVQIKPKRIRSEFESVQPKYCEIDHNFRSGQLV